MALFCKREIFKSSVKWKGGGVHFFVMARREGGTSFIDTSFPLQTAKPSRGWNNHVKWQSSMRRKNSVLNQYFCTVTLTLK